MQREYNKLVRDRIPEIIQRDGYHCEIEQMDEAAYIQALREKLIEEACEVATASESELSKEMADLVEVMVTLMKAYKISQQDVQSEQIKRRKERGGFEQRIRLLTMTDQASRGV